MKTIKIRSVILGGVTLAIFFFFVQNSRVSKEDKNIIIENAEMRLIIGANGKPISLLHKPSREECLETGVRFPIIALTEYRPYDSENMLTYVARSTAYPASEITREGNKLKVKFDRIAYPATITLDIQPDYIGFKLTGLDYDLEKVSDWKRKTEIDVFTILQLPIKKRGHFGEWLNIAWDENVAIGITATDPYGKIDALDNETYYLMQAGVENIVNLLNVSVVLIATEKKNILDNIDRIEQDYGLPHGVRSYRGKAYKYSYYEMRSLTPQNIDEHITNAKKGGFKMMTFYWTDFAESLGHFVWREEYPNGIDDLKDITDKLKTGVTFIYFDGGEDLHPPYWYYGSKAQLDAYNTCNPKPLVSEGALKTHFGWHILTRANAYDTFKPELFREGVRHYMLQGAQYMADNFTSINFGWNIYLAPSATSNGMQPNMHEYVCSRGVGWDSPISLMIVSLDEIRNHPRGNDNFEVMKNWEDARLSGFLTEEQKEMLKDAYQEHILIRNSKGGFELFPYKKVNIAQNSNDIIAYLFERNNETLYIGIRMEARKSDCR